MKIFQLTNVILLVVLLAKYCYYVFTCAKAGNRSNLSNTASIKLSDD